MSAKDVKDIFTEDVRLYRYCEFARTRISRPSFEEDRMSSTRSTRRRKWVTDRDPRWQDARELVFSLRRSPWLHSMRVRLFSLGVFPFPGFPFTVSPLSTSYARDRLRCAKTTAVFATIFASRLRAWKTTSRTHRVANDVIRCAFVRIITHRGCFQPLERLSASATFRENARQYLTV